MVCSDYASGGGCNNDPNCEWIGSPKNGMCQDAVPCEPVAEVRADGVDNDCDGLVDCADPADGGTDPVCQVTCSNYTTRNLCNAQAACRWDNRGKSCVPDRSTETTA